jgi:hypothetical protein
MKPLVLVMILLFVALSSLGAWAAAVCFPRSESLAFHPTTATFNGQPVTRSATTGRYATDAGFEFDHELAQLTALHDAGSTACPEQAQEVTLDLTDPFTGQHVTLQLVTP